MTRPRVPVLLALVALAIPADRALALTIVTLLPPGPATLADVLTYRLGTSCCRDVVVLVQPWMHKDPDMPWKILTTGNVDVSTMDQLNQKCELVAAEEKAIFGPGHVFETRFTTPQRKIHGCAVVRMPLAPQVPPLMSRPDGLALIFDPDIWSSAWTACTPMKSITVEIKPAIPSEQEDEP